MYRTSNYLFATYLQTSECGNKKIEKVEVTKPGRAFFSFNIEEGEVEKYKMQFNDSVCYEFENKRKQTIGLTYD